jgi:hypothetical protein
MSDQGAESSGALQGRPPRWPAVLAMSLFCVAGGSVAFFNTKPLHRAVALINVRATEPGAASPSSLDAEVLLIRSKTILDRAMTGRNWSRSWPTTQRAVNEMLERLSARAVGGHVIEVTYFDADASAAEGRLRAIALAYSDYVNNRHVSEITTRQKLLYDRLSLFAGEAARLDTQLIDSFNELGTSDLASLEAHQLNKVAKLEQMMLDLSIAPSAVTRPTTNPAVSMLAERLEVEKKALTQTARIRFKVEELRRHREAASSERDQLSKRLNDLMLESGLPGPVRVLSAGEISGRPIDGRPRNVAWGALAGLIPFFVVRLVARWWRERRRVLSAKTAFPVIITHTPEPKPVIPIEAGAVI